MTRARELSKLINASSFSVDSDFNVGVNSTSPDVKLDVGGAVLVTGISTFENTTESTSSTTGALIVSGGVGIAKSLNVGGNLSVAGTITYDDVTNIDSVGIITAQSGVSIADSIFHTGDTDTAIRFPAANTFTVETAGSEALRVDSTGKLLQGKTATKGSTGENVPTYCTEIANTSNPNVLEIVNNGTTSSSYSALALVRSDGTSVNSHTAVDSGDKIGEVCYIGADGADRFNTAAAIAAFANADFTANNCPADLVFYTNGGSATASERLRITSVGEVRVGSAFSVSQAGVVTATEFHGDASNLTNLPASGDSNDITASLFI